MTVENIIRSLEEQAKDRESSIDEADPACLSSTVGTGA